MAVKERQSLKSQKDLNFEKDIEKRTVDCFRKLSIQNTSIYKCDVGIFCKMFPS